MNTWKNINNGAGIVTYINTTGSAIAYFYKRSDTYGTINILRNDVSGNPFKGFIGSNGWKWNDFILNADIGHVEKRIDNFSATLSNKYARIGNPTDYGVPSGTAVIGCQLIGWSNMSAGDIYFTANDSNVFVFSNSANVSATYITLRFVYLK